MEYLTAGESHGEKLTGIIAGIPAGLTIDIEKINSALLTRQSGYGRGRRQIIEKDEVKITGGVRGGVTLGSPISIEIKNKDHVNWKGIMETDPKLIRKDEKYNHSKVTCPRPGHADLVGGMKYGHRDLRNVLERSSARETALKVVFGNICEQLLEELDIRLVGYVTKVGKISTEDTEIKNKNVTTLREKIRENDLRIIDETKISDIHRIIQYAHKKGDTLGGEICVLVENLPVGLGSYVSWEQKIDARLASAIMGINAVKGVSFGKGFELSSCFGSETMDEIVYDKKMGYTRKTNRLGGIEGGMTSGMPLIVNAVFKPIPTLQIPLETVDISTKNIAKASTERSDTTAIVPASFISENIVAIEIAKIVLETFESSNLERLKLAVNSYRKRMIEY